MKNRIRTTVLVTALALLFGSLARAEEVPTVGVEVLSAMPGELQTTPAAVIGQTSIIQWDQAVAAGDTILPPTYEYRLIVDAKPDVLIKQTCAVGATASTYVCEAPLPPQPTGGHSLVLFARVNIAGTNYAGGVSTALPVISLLIEVPKNLRLKATQ